MVITMSLQLANNNTNNTPLRAHQGRERIGNPYSTAVYLVIVQALGSTGWTIQITARGVVPI